MPSVRDQQLVTAILDATSSMSLRERERATGVSHATFQRFANGFGSKNGWKALQGKTRKSVVAYLERAGKMPEPILSVPVPDAERARLIGLLEEALRLLKGP